jgi:tRNA1Val (adenine37-N6)-methyltransferase
VSAAGIDTLLGGRVLHAQREGGHRSGIEPVLMAAAVPARPGQRVLEAGIGSGAGLLCLAARVPGVRGVGVEQDAELADLARINVAGNRFDGIDIVTGDIAGFVDDKPFDPGMPRAPPPRPTAPARPRGRRRTGCWPNGRWPWPNGCAIAAA